MTTKGVHAGVTAYPLSWPENRKRTPSNARERSRFKTTSFARVRDDLFAEIGRLGASAVVLSTNIPLRRDGIPVADYGQPDDSGVALYFVSRSGGRKCFACDRWRRIEDNMHAIEMTIAALRGIERWGSGEDTEAAFLGFAALPPRARPWWEVLGVQQTDPLTVCETSRRRLAQSHHPDRNGDPAIMAEINEAFDRATKYHENPDG